MREKIQMFGCICFVIAAFSLPLSVTGYSIFIPLACLATLCSYSWSDRGASFLKNSAIISLLVLTLLLLASVIYTHADHAFALKTFKSYAKFLYVPFLVLLLPNQRWRFYVLSGFLLGVGIVAITAIVTVLFHLKYYYDPTGIFHNHIDASLQLALAALICLVWSIHAKNSQKRWLCGAFACLFIITLLFFNEGRTGMLAFFLVLPVLLVREFNTKTSLLLLAIIVVSIFLIIKLDISGMGKRFNAAIHNAKLYSAKGDNATSSGLRLSFFKASVGFIKQRPVLGYGIGSFKDLYYEKYGYPPGWTWKLINPNNEYLTIGVQLGLVGMFVLIWLFAACLKLSYDMSGTQKVYFYLILLYIVGSLTESLLRLSVSGVLFTIIVSLMISASSETKA